MPDPGTTILVTGGAGYIGSHACKALAQRGYEPVVVDNLENGREEAVKWGPFEHCDLLDRERLREIVCSRKPAAAMHFAAYAYVGESVRRPAAYYRNNVAGAINLLDALMEAGGAHFVFSSTCATYGIPDEVPIPESTVQRPINPYGRSKLMIEQLLSDYSAAYGLRACSLRYFNAAGADPDGELGEVHDPEPHLIPNILRAAMGRAPALQVFGDDYDTGDGTCVRDFIHVTDLAEAHCLALEYLPGRDGHHAFNLGSAAGHSVLEVVRAAEAVTGRPVPLQVEARRPGDPPVLVADAARARAELGWQPRHSDLSEILSTAWRWEQSRTGVGGPGPAR